MKATDLYKIGSSKAPYEWESLPEISESKPRIRNKNN